LRSLGVSVAARKLAQSFEPDDDPAGLDAAVLAAATGESPDEVCLPHRSYEVAMAPPMAAEVLGRSSFTIADLLGELMWPAREVGAGTKGGVGVGLVESAGGVCSPQADDGDAVELCRVLGPDVVILVADAGLGTINAVRASVGALEAPPIVVLNRFDAGNELHVRNREWLRDRDNLCTVALPGEEPMLVALIRGEVGAEGAFPNAGIGGDSFSGAYIRGQARGIV